MVPFKLCPLFKKITLICCFQGHHFNFR